MPYLIRVPRLLRWLQPRGLVWQAPAHTPAPTVYLTFDDGPHPDVTPHVLQELDRYNAAATFFCVGENAARYAPLFQDMLRSRHTVGNHTHHHRNGWKTPADAYVADTDAAAAHIPRPLFRPPYGRITRDQAQRLQAGGYTIVMWEVLSGDFDATLTPEHCYQNVVRHARPGSIIVFHDSLKAAPRLLPTLPRVLAHFQKQGWSMHALTPSLLS